MKYQLVEIKGDVSEFVFEDEGLKIIELQYGCGCFNWLKHVKDNIYKVEIAVDERESTALNRARRALRENGIKYRFIK